ncbi:MAG: ferredoxin--nitrite reductase [Helicobacteraceae bacterium]|nr:ferredoxin--nitrite reductase [Helicobacteraceae bacterium]
MSKMEEAFNERNKKLNKIEKLKNDGDAKSSFDKLDYYAQNGFDSIPDEDKSYFLKCFGIYYRPATPEQFMIKIRIPGGQLNAEQASVIGYMAQKYGNDYIDLTTRSQSELRFVSIENIPTILKALNAVGMSTFQTGVDNVRNILNDPLDELGFDNILPSQNLLLNLQDDFLNNWEWISTLPRKFNASITGSTTNRCNVFGNDCCFVLAQKDGIYGYNLYLGGKVGVIAKNADLFLKDEAEVKSCFQALLEIFKEYGFRDNRNKNRLHFLIESVGMTEFTKTVRERAKIEFATCGITLTQLDNADNDQGKIALKDGSYAVHMVVPSGVFSGGAMIKVSEVAKKYGNSLIRLDTTQSLYILGVQENSLELLLKEEIFEEFKSVNTPYFNNLIACAGVEHCPFGVIPNKSDAIEMAEYLSVNVELPENSRVRMYWSACVKGCGVHGLADIGFEGCKAKVDGVSEYGVNILLGGKVSSESKEGHSVLKSVPLRFARFYVESIVSEYRRLKNLNETFESFYDRILSNYSHASIGFLMVLLAYAKKENIELGFGFKDKISATEEVEIEEIGTTLKYNCSELEDEKIKDLIVKMNKDNKNRAVVFSELVQIKF